MRTLLLLFLLSGPLQAKDLSAEVDLAFWNAAIANLSCDPATFVSYLRHRRARAHCAPEDRLCLGRVGPVLHRVCGAGGKPVTHKHCRRIGDAAYQDQDLLCMLRDARVWGPRSLRSDREGMSISQMHFNYYPRGEPVETSPTIEAIDPLPPRLFGIAPDDVLETRPVPPLLVRFGEINMARAEATLTQLPTMEEIAGYASLNFVERREVAENMAQIRQGWLAEDGRWRRPTCEVLAVGVGDADMIRHAKAHCRIDYLVERASILFSYVDGSRDGS